MTALSTLWAQSSGVIGKAEAGRVDDTVQVCLSLQPVHDVVADDEVLTIIPRLVAPADTLTLPAIHLLGRQPYYRYIRHDDMGIILPTDYTMWVKYQPEDFAYVQHARWQPWMDMASLQLTIQRTRHCQTDSISMLTAQSTHMVFQQAPPIINMQTDSVMGSVTVRFPLDQTDIRPDYLGNNRELSRLQRSISSVIDHKDVQLKSISIRGYASPEGRYDHNEYLARERTNSLGQYVSKLNDIPADKIKTEWVAENWGGLIRAIRQASTRQLPHRSQLLEIAENPDLQPDEKEQVMRKHYPADFQWLLKNVLPLLRQTDYRIDYVKRQVIEQQGRMDTVYQMPAATPLRQQQYTPLRPYTALFALKTNVLFDLALAFNGEIEVPLGRSNRWSVMGEFWKPWYVWNRNSRAYQLQVIGAEVRYWLGSCRTQRPVLTGWFVAPYYAYGKYDFEWDTNNENEGYNGVGDQGEFHSVGLSLGYSWPIHRHWNLELSGAVGAFWGPRRHYHGEFDDTHLIWKYTTNTSYVGPTKLKVSLVWLIGKQRKENRP